MLTSNFTILYAMVKKYFITIVGWNYNSVQNTQRQTDAIAGFIIAVYFTGHLIIYYNTL